jgi:acylphosphatase
VQKYGVTGWAKNTHDGKVEVAAEGEENRLKQFLSDLESEMSHYIREKKVNWEPATKEFVNFQIKF